MEIGDRFGHLTVIAKNGRKITCRCDCGNEKTVDRTNLRSGRTQSCGCKQGRAPSPAPIGEKYGMLTVIGYAGPRRLLCRCDCGNETVLWSYNVLSGHTTSCGCRPNGRKAAPIEPGARFGMLTILSVEGSKVLCRCDCGNEKLIDKYSVTKGRSRSCGCMRGQKQ